MADCFRQFLDRKRTVGVDAPITGLMNAMGRVNGRLGVFEFGQQPVQFLVFALRGGERGLSVSHSGSPSVSRTRPRNSKIEIIGRKRMNRNNSVMNNPSEPNRWAKSQLVG